MLLGFLSCDCAFLTGIYSLISGEFLGLIIVFFFNFNSGCLFFELIFSCSEASALSLNALLLYLVVNLLVILNLVELLVVLMVELFALVDYSWLLNFVCLGNFAKFSLKSISTSSPGAPMENWLLCL